MRVLYFCILLWKIIFSLSLNDLANQTWRRHLVVSRIDKLATEGLKKTRNCFPKMWNLNFILYKSCHEMQ
jgi:hypothetical protein